METTVVLAALTAACLHAGYNAAIKQRPRPVEAMMVHMVLAAVMVLPILAWVGLPPARSWPWIAVTIGVSQVSISALLYAYTLAPFGLVYPLARATAVLLVMPGATFVLGEQLSPTALFGVALIAVALAIMALTRGDGQTVRKTAWGLIALIGGMSAVAVLVESFGVRTAGSALSYGALTAVANAFVMAWRHRDAGFTRQSLLLECRAMLPVALASIVSYLLMLWVLLKGPVAIGAALRDTSAVFALLISYLWMKEAISPRHLYAILLAALAIPLMRLG